MKPQVRIYEGGYVEVWSDGAWCEADVEDLRTLRVEMDPHFELNVTITYDDEEG